MALTIALLTMDSTYLQLDVVVAMESSNWNFFCIFKIGGSFVDALKTVSEFLNGSVDFTLRTVVAGIKAVSAGFDQRPYFLQN